MDLEGRSWRKGGRELGLERKNKLNGGGRKEGGNCRVEVGGKGGS